MVSQVTGFVANQVMKTAGRKTHKRYVASREFGAESENKSRSITRGLEINKNPAEGEVSLLTTAHNP
jgi:hypothetical protein